MVSLIATLAIGTPHGAQAATIFTDVLPGNQYFESVSALQKRGVINGYADGTFRPNQDISRAAALKIILMATGTEITGVASQPPFPDVPVNEWYAPIAKKGRDLGVVKGDAAGNFIPARQVSRSEALAMLYRTAGINPPSPSEPPFNDTPVTAWYAGYFAQAKQDGLFSGSSINPDQYITRGQVAEITYEFFKSSWLDSEMVGEASYYGSSFEGRNTASGEKLQNGEFTAAHKTLPFGTRVKVTHRETLESVVVRITDRGPFVAGRIIDLTQAAFETLAPLSRGVMPVELEVVPESVPLGPPQNCAPAIDNIQIADTVFDGVKLLGNVPGEFRKNEVFLLRGEFLTDPAPNRIVAMIKSSGYERTFHGTVNGKIFTIPLELNQNGTFTLSLFPGDTRSSNAAEIKVLEMKCDPNVNAETGGATNLRARVQNGDTILYWDDGQNDLFRIEIEQGRKKVTFYVRDQTTLTPPPRALDSFSSGQATVKIWSAKTNSGNVFDRQTAWAYGGEIDLFLVDRVSRHQNRLQNVSLTDQYKIGQRITLSGNSSNPLNPQVYIIDPDEEIITQQMEIKSNGDFLLHFTPQKAGAYLFEINQDDALALFVGSSVLEGTVPLLPDYFDMDEVEGKTASNELPDTMLKLINQERLIRKSNTLKLDGDLSSLAQFRADDMCNQNYFSHVDPEGKKAADYRVIHNVQTAIGENIAKDSSLRAAHESLMRSPAHRKLIIDESFTRVGLGFCTDPNNSDAYVIVQIFGGDPYNTNEIPDLRQNVLEQVNSVRTENPIVPNVVLEGVAQQWAQNMAEQNFWGFEFGDQSLEKSLREAGINASTQAIVLKIGSVSELYNAFLQPNVAIGETNESNFLLQQNITKMGLGIAQSTNWELYVVILAVE